MPSSIPLAAIAAPAPTSRATFRHLGRAVGATNREADALRVGLLGRITGPGSTATDADDASLRALITELQTIDRSDPDGTLGAEVRLAAWFRHAASDGDRRIDVEVAVALVEAWTTDAASVEAMQSVVTILRGSGSERAHDD